MQLEFWGLYLGLLCNMAALQTELEMQEVGNVDVDGRWGREGGAGTRNRDAKGSNNLSHGCVQDHLRKQAQQTGGES